MLHEEKYAGQLSSPGLGKKEELVETAPAACSTGLSGHEAWYNEGSNQQFWSKYI
jgi:hypothetical protein